MTIIKAKFFNFPLIALAYGTSEKERLETLMMWAIIDVGRRTLKHWQKRINAATPTLAINHFLSNGIHCLHPSRSRLVSAAGPLGEANEDFRNRRL